MACDIVVLPSVANDRDGEERSSLDSLEVLTFEGLSAPLEAEDDP